MATRPTLRSRRGSTLSRGGPITLGCCTSRTGTTPACSCTSTTGWAARAGPLTIRRRLERAGSRRMGRCVAYRGGRDVGVLTRMQQSMNRNAAGCEASDARRGAGREMGAVRVVVVRHGGVVRFEASGTGSGTGSGTVQVKAAAPRVSCMCSTVCV